MDRLACRFGDEMLKRTLRRAATDLLTSPTGRFVALGVDVLLMSAAYLVARVRRQWARP
jgi:hypothetical protein